MSNKKLALFFACCAAAGITATACNESAEWKPDVVECTDGMKICQNNAVKECKEGAWTVVQECKDATPICDSSNYTCVAQTSPSCTNGDVKCDNNILLQCVNGQWNATPCNSAQTCDLTSKSCKENGTVAECEAEAVKCEADAENEGKATMFSCADGKWVKGDACDEGMVCGTDDAGKAACVSGESEKCEAEAVKCEADADNDNTPTLYNCDADGNWVKGDPCEEGMICGTDEDGKAACVAAAEECVPGCVDNVLTTCGDDGKVVKNCADDFMICGKDGEGEDAVDACVLDPDVKYCAEYELADGTKKSIAADKEICDGAKIVKCTIPDDATEAVEATVETDCAVDAEGNATGKVCGPMSEEDASLACVDPTIEPEKCEADAIKCEEDANNDNKPTMFKCNADGAWEVDVACAEGELCGKKTEGDAEVDACVEPVKCTIDGDTTEYEHGAKRCDEAVVKVCNGGTGAWDTDTDCAANADLPVCLEGACVACIAEDTKCVAEKDTNDVWSHKLFTCTAENTWGEGVACTDGKVCDTATPSKECKDVKDLVTCTEDGAVCVTIYDAETFAYCSSGAASFAEMCSGDTPICNADLQSCVEPAVGCKDSDLCNATVLASADSCKAKYQDISATGEIKCNEACNEIDYSACKYCGDGEIQTAQGEQCEGTDIGTATCADVDPNKTWKDGGVPACEGCVLVAGTCEEDTSCTDGDYRCTDGVREKCTSNAWAADACATVENGTVTCDATATDYCKLACADGFKEDGGACVPDGETCTDGAYRCTDGVREKCTSNAWAADACATVENGTVTCDATATDYCKLACADGFKEDGGACVPDGETCTDDDNSCTDTETGSTVVTCTDGKKTETTSEFSCKDPKTVGVCKNADTKCAEGKLSTCAKGTWGEATDCESGSCKDEKVCAEPECTDADNKCTDTATGSTVVTCTAGKKTETTSEFSCKEDGLTAGECLNADTKCADGKLSTCAKGVWGTATDCESGSCKDEKVCADAAPECTDADNKCTDTETGSTVVTCTAGKKTETTSEFSCKEDGKTAGECLNDATKCADGKLSTCAKGVWGAATDCESGSCKDEVVCADPITKVQCELDGTKYDHDAKVCDGKVARTCVVSGTEWSWSDTSCSYECSDGACVDQCTTDDITKCGTLPENATAWTCNTGVCELTCADGFKVDGDKCVCDDTAYVAWCGDNKITKCEAGELKVENCALGCTDDGNPSTADACNTEDACVEGFYDPWCNADGQLVTCVAEHATPADCEDGKACVDGACKDWSEVKLSANFSVSSPNFDKSGSGYATVWTGKSGTDFENVSFQGNWDSGTNSTHIAMNGTSHGYFKVTGLNGIGKISITATGWAGTASNLEDAYYVISVDDVEVGRVTNLNTDVNISKDVDVNDVNAKSFSINVFGSVNGSGTSNGRIKLKAVNWTTMESAAVVK